MDDLERSLTDLLSDGRRQIDLRALVERLYPELRRLARSAMGQERGEHTLQMAGESPCPNAFGGSRE
jgi:DNA-directed RNA polymerase specialized sigma24 family protein